LLVAFATRQRKRVSLLKGKPIDTAILTLG
jgi:hypothetical protein